MRKNASGGRVVFASKIGSSVHIDFHHGKIFIGSGFLRGAAFLRTLLNRPSKLEGGCDRKWALRIVGLFFLRVIRTTHVLGTTHQWSPVPPLSGTPDDKWRRKMQSGD